MWPQYLGEWQVLLAEQVIVHVVVLVQDSVCVWVMLHDQQALTTGTFLWYLAFALRELLGVIFRASGDEHICTNCRNAHRNRYKGHGMANWMCIVFEDKLQRALEHDPNAAHLYFLLSEEPGSWVTYEELGVAYMPRGGAPGCKMATYLVVHVEVQCISLHLSTDLVDTLAGGRKVPEPDAPPFQAAHHLGL
jgi:hypothetical protein